MASLQYVRATHFCCGFSICVVTEAQKLMDVITDPCEIRSSLKAAVKMHHLVGHSQNRCSSKISETAKIKHRESSEATPELTGMHSPIVVYPCLTVCLPKCFLTLREGPDLNCFHATDAFLSSRNETLRMSRCALKMAATPAPS